MTDNNARQPTAGWICYDGDCPFCLRWVRRIEHPRLHHGFGIVPLQTAWVKARLNVPEGELLKEMRLLLPDQRILSGADAAAALARYVWWLWPFWFISRIPGVMSLFRISYRNIAKHRYCFIDSSTGKKRAQAQHRHNVFFEMP